MSTVDITPNTNSRNGWTEEIETLLKHWYEIARLYQGAHLEQAQYHTRLNTLISVPLMITTTLITVILPFSYDRANPIRGELNIILLILSTLATILSGVINFVKPSENASIHTNSSKDYATIYEELNTQLTLSPNMRENARVVLGRYSEKINQLRRTGPSTTYKMYMSIMQLSMDNRSWTINDRNSISNGCEPANIQYILERLNDDVSV